MISTVRREGFTGQHLVAVPSPVRDRMAQHPLLRSLMVTDAGYYPCAEGHRVERPEGAATHLIILCLRGAGWAGSRGRTFPVETGDILWLPADMAHAYGAAENDPWTILWAHFRGTEVSAWRQELGWAIREPLGQFRFGPERAGTLGLEKVHAHLEAGYSLRHLLGAVNALRQTFCAAIDLMTSAGLAKTADERTAAVRDEIVADPAQAYRLEELATAAGLSIPHFSLLFRRQTGFSPIDFLIRQRISKACRLIDNSRARIADISCEVGFNDAYYFSRCFRKVMGVSPRTYRNSVKG